MLKNTQISQKSMYLAHRNHEKFGICVSEFVVGSGEKDYLFSVSSLLFSCSSGLSDFEVTCA